MTTAATIQLKHLTQTSCPECGAPWISVGYANDGKGTIQRHINGGVWENITFACGRCDGYVPNFLHVEMIRPCRNSHDEKQDQKRRDEAAMALKDSLKKLQLTGLERDHLLRDIDQAFRRY